MRRIDKKDEGVKKTLSKNKFSPLSTAVSGNDVDSVDNLLRCFVVEDTRPTPVALHCGSDLQG